MDDEVVGEWLAGDKHDGTVPALGAMFNDAASAKVGRVVRHNPFARLSISKGPGRHEQPLSEEKQVWTLIRCARELARPSGGGLTASERYEASDALHGKKASGDIQADMTYGELVAWLRQWKDRWQPS